MKFRSATLGIEPAVTRKEAAVGAASPVVHALLLLTDVASTILAPEHRSGLTDETAVVAAVVAAPVIAVIIGVEVVSERRGCDRARGADGAADDAGRYVTRPESAVSM